MKRANKTPGHDSEHVMTWSKLMHLLCETQSCVKNGVFCFDSPPVSSDQEAFLELPRFFPEGRLKISGKMDMKYGRFLVVKGPGTIQANIAAQEPVVRGMPKVDAVIVLMDGAKLVNTSKKSLRDGHVRYFIGKGCDVEFKNCDVKAADMHEFVTYDLQRTLDHAGNQSKEKIERALRKRIAEAFVPYARSGIDDVYCGAGPGIDPSQYFLRNGTFEKELGVSRLDEAFDYLWGVRHPGTLGELFCHPLPKSRRLKCLKKNEVEEGAELMSSDDIENQMFADEYVGSNFGCYDITGLHLVDGSPIGTFDEVMSWAEEELGHLVRVSGFKLPAWMSQCFDCAVYRTRTGKKIMLCREHDFERRACPF